MKKRICICLLFLAMVLMWSACGRQEPEGEPVTVKIHDGTTTTILDTRQGISVKDMLLEAELSLGDKDQLEPADADQIDADHKNFYIQRYAAVTVTCDDQAPVQVELCGAKVKDALKTSGIEVDQNDLINHDEDLYLFDGMDIQVTKRTQVTVKVDGEKHVYITEAKTVGKLLKEAGIDLGKKDRMNKKKKQALKEGMKIRIKRVSERKVIEKEPIPFSTEYENTSALYVGSSKTKQEGINGEKEIHYKVTYVDGKEESRVKVREVETIKPLPRIILQGTKEKPKPVKKPDSPSGGKTIVSKQYYDDCDGSGHGVCIITYSDGSTKQVAY